MGSSTISPRQIKDLCGVADEDELRSTLKAELLPPAIEQMRAAMRPRCPECKRGGNPRWAVRNVLEMAKLVGAQPQVLLGFFQSHGVAGEGEMARLLESGRRFEKMTEDATADLETLRDEAVSLLEDLLKEKPEWRKEILARLGSTVTDSLDPRNGNGYGNGNGTTETK